MDLHLSVFLLLMAELIHAVTSVSILPTHAHLDLQNSVFRPVDLRISCTSQQPITACQFKVGDHAHIDVVTGSNADQTRGLIFDGAVGFCAVTLPSKLFAVDGTTLKVGCRVRDAVGDWRYAAMSVYSSVRRGLQLSIARRVVLASPGETVNILTTTPTALASCSLLLQGAWLPLNDTASCLQPKHCYHGNELASGECGVTIKNVGEADNGKVWLRATDEDNREDADFVHVVVAKPPSDMTLAYNITANENGTMTLKARCAVIGGRPTPKITWYIAGDEIKDGVASVPADQWAWLGEEKTLNQSLTRIFRENDRGKELRCTAFYMHQGKTETITKDISLHLPNSSSEDGYRVAACTVFGIVILLYIAVLTIHHLVMYAMGRDIWCFKRLAFMGGASQDASDVMDYHITVPTQVTLRKDILVESYLEVVQPQQDNRDSYFLPLPSDARRISTKAVKTLGLTSPTSKAPPPHGTKYVKPHKKPKPSKAALKAAPESLFTPTPLSEMQQEVSEGTYKATVEDEIPIYVNIFPTATSEPPVYGNIEVDEINDPVYGNLQVVDINPRSQAGATNAGTTDVGATDSMYGYIYPGT